MNAELEEKRKILKKEFVSSDKKTIVDVLLFKIGRRKLIPTWSGIFLIFFITLLISVVLGLISGGIASIYQSLPGLPPFWTFWVIYNLFTCTALMVLANVFIHRMFELFRNHIIDHVTSIETLNRIQNWVNWACKKGPGVTITVLLGGLFESVLLINIVQKFMGTIGGFRPTIFLWLFVSQSLIFLMFSLLILALAFQIKDFDLALFEANPAGSETITKLSEWFSGFVYLLSIYGTLQTFGLIRLGLLSYFLAMLFSFWTPIVFIFITSHIGLASIIQRNKWKTLNSIQQKVSAFQMDHSMPSKDDREYLFWLLDYHERVKATQNSAIDLRSSASFLNSLLLPVVAFILGNMDTLLKLFSPNP